MNHAIRSARTYPTTLLSARLPSQLGTKASAISFRQLTTMATQQEMNHNKDNKAQNANEKTGDVMSHSFGEGYATRSDEEGFGGIYGGRNQSISKLDQDKLIHENHPAYDKTQGSEVKEKEKGRFQKEASS